MPWLPWEVSCRGHPWALLAGPACRRLESVLRAPTATPWIPVQHRETKQAAPGLRFRSSGGHTYWCGRSRIRTWVACATDLQSAPIGRSGNLPG